MERVVIVVVAALAASCATTSVRPSTVLDDEAITVGSFNFPESEILAEIYAQALERAGYRVERRLGVGTREIVEPALERGLLELVPEYAGSLLEFLTGRSAPPGVDGARAALVEALSARGLVALTASPAQDRNAVVVTSRTARRHGVEDVSDLAGVDSDLVFGGPPECSTRPLCLKGLRTTYGLSFARFVPLDEAGPVTVAALASGQVDVALMFSSDGAIAANRFVVLRDDRRLQPAENITPVLAAGVLEQVGAGVVDVIDDVSARLTTRDLRSLNESVSAGRSPAEVAAGWAAAHGLDTRSAGVSEL
jgi:osmoprotectant transport system substrate-binding protein